jgi:hypothetical protein
MEANRSCEPKAGTESVTIWKFIPDLNWDATVYGLLRTDNVRPHIDDAPSVHGHRLETTILGDGDRAEVDSHGKVVTILDDFGHAKLIASHLCIAH